MPHLNPLLYPTLLLAGILFIFGFRLAGRLNSFRAVAFGSALCVAVSLPAVLFAAYYGHVLDRAAWFYAIRAVPFSELAAAGLGLAAGFAAGLLGRTAFVKSSPFLARFVPALLVFCMTLVIFV